MTTTTLNSQTRFSRFNSDMFSGSPILSRNAVALFALFLVCLVLPAFDDRLFNGINVWHKPAKFFLSLAVLFATIAWALSLVDEPLRKRRVVRWSVVALIFASWAELTYITFRAARAEGSHYNVDTPLEQALYSIMGLGALTMTGASAIIGFIIWRNRNGDIWREAAGFGLVLGAILGTATAFVLASGTSHWIGGDQTDATGLPLFYWSTTGGDLRVAHFIGLHAMQIVPFAALSGKRSVVYAVALAIIALTAAAFVQAVMGIPLFKP
jgi:glucan phosphoethanolaminetransferase (alkaline phosphatase superfamily)